MCRKQGRELARPPLPALGFVASSAVTGCQWGAIKQTALFFTEAHPWQQGLCGAGHAFMAAQLSSSCRGEWVSSSFPFYCIMGMMAKSLSCLPLHTVGYGAQIQMGRKHSGTIMDTYSSEAQWSHMNNEKNGTRTPVSMQIWNSQRSPERQLYWHLKLNLSLRLLLLWVLHCFCFACVLTWFGFRFSLRKNDGGRRLNKSSSGI